MLFSIKTFRKYAWELSFKLPFTPFTQVLNKVCVFKPFVHLFSSNATVNDLVQILPTIVIFSKIVLQPLKFIHLSTIDTRLIFLKFSSDYIYQQNPLLFIIMNQISSTVLSLACGVLYYGVTFSSLSSPFCSPLP